MKFQIILNKMNKKTLIYSCLHMDYITSEYVVNLVDKIIVNNKCIKYQETLIGISLSNNKSDIISILENMQDEPLEDILPYYLSLYRIIFESRILPLNVLIDEILKSYRVLHSQFLYGDGASTIDADNYDFFFTMLEDYCSLIKDKLSGNINVNEHLSSFLSEYVYPIDCFLKMPMYIRDYKINDIIIMK